MKNIRFFFSKLNEAKYFSHLDVYRIFTRAIKLSRIDIWYTEGFNSHLYLNFALPLALGYESCCECFDVKLNNEEELSMVERINQFLPENFKVTGCGEPVFNFNDIGYSRYLINLSGSDNTFEVEKLKQFIDSEEIFVEKKTKRGMKTVDIKPQIKSFDITKKKEAIVIDTVLESGVNTNLNPSLVFSAFCEHTDSKKIDICVKRIEILTKDLKKFL